MGILDVIQKTLDEQGNGGKVLRTGMRVLETPRQAKYNDVRKIERNYTKGVHNAKKQQKP